MLPIVDKPIIDYIVSELKDAGIEEVLIILGRNKEILANYFDRNIEIENRIGCPLENKQCANFKIYFLRQEEAKGTGYATSLAKNFVAGEPFVLMFGDEIIFSRKSVTKQLIDAFDNKTLIAVQKVKMADVHKYGIVKIDSISHMIDLVEKPNRSEAPSNLSYLGPAVLLPEIFDEIDKIEINQKNMNAIENNKPLGSSPEIGITSAYQSLARQNKISHLKVSGKRFDTGSPIGLIKANVYAASHNKKSKAEFRGFLKGVLRG
jgi:UTP--glucose-1-phosphate uridylyltransferase